MRTVNLGVYVILIICLLISYNVRGDNDDNDDDDYDLDIMKDDEFNPHDGSFKFKDITKFIQHKPRNITEKDVNFTIYTRNGCTSALDISSSEIQCFNPSSTTKILIHGFLARGVKTFNKTKNAYLASENDYNVIIVDWSKPASCWHSKVTAVVKNCYTIIVKNYLFQVGNFIAKLLDKLEHNGQKMRDVHIIGHSLGAHLAGVASTNARKRKQIARITGLDPAGPLFNKANVTSGMLDKHDALFVDVIHTNIKYFGIVKPLGTADFYPYDGTNQPGCGFPAGITQKCSHSAANRYFTESILDPWKYTAVPCSDKNEYERDTCNGTDVIHMGEYVPQTAQGIYYVSAAEDVRKSKKLLCFLIYPALSFIRSQLRIHF